MSQSDITTATPGAAAAPAAPAVQIPEDYEELKSYRDRYNQLAETITPYLDDIRPIIEDDESREFWRSARSTYEQQKEARKPRLTPELEMIRDEFKETLTPLVEYVGSERTAKERAEQERIASAQQANLDYAKRLVAERPQLAEDDYAGIGMLAAYAANRNISLEEAYKRAGDRFASAPPPKEKPPTSLRGDGAAPGVPGESKLPPIKSTVDLRKRLANNLRAAGMKG